MSNCIAETLEIKDENVIWENRVERFSNGYITAKCYFGILTYAPNHCENCGFPNENHRIVKNGKRQILIKVPKVSEVPTYISLKKQRFLCRQ
ncbi:transposase family protein, partial [Staphylococcus borealis]|uniref:transposase family protein n=1 Tax=Staphylococcus borealis TaxID=2742203 RepID=UPI0025A10B18